jgi:hypothetical protein
MRKTLYLFCGLCWLAFGLFVGLFVVQYLAHGAGLQESGYYFLIFLPYFSSGSIVLGVMHLIGLAMLSLLLTAIGLCLCLRAFDPPPELSPREKRERWRTSRREWNR